jgi:hypothetical protein
VGRILVAVVAVSLLAGCGGSSGPRRAATPPLPGALARAWASRADAIAAAADQKNYCKAQRLAGALKTEVADSLDRIPARYRSPLLSSVTSLSTRFACVPIPPKPPKHHGPPPGHGPKPPKPPKDHGHGPGPGDGGDGG